jgi:hypothetical protein
VSRAPMGAASLSKDSQKASGLDPLFVSLWSTGYVRQRSPSPTAHRYYPANLLTTAMSERQLPGGGFYMCALTAPIAAL